MKKISLILCCCLVCGIACRKQLNDIQPGESLSAPPCTPAHWSATPDYPLGFDFDRFIFVYQNKLYVPDQSNKMRTYNGSTWTEIDSEVPYTYYNAGFCFTIGDKGYLSQGGINDGKKLWEYSITSNIWTEKTSFPGSARYFASCFVIGTKAYIVGGMHSSGFFRDVWEYNSITDVWAQKANVPNTFLARAGATGFSINNKGYMVCGYYRAPGSTNTRFFRDLMEYDPINDSWILKSTFPGKSRAHCNVFLATNSAYIGGGGEDLIGLSNEDKDFYRYYQGGNTWAQIVDYPASTPTSLGYTINNRGYVIGYGGMYKYNPSTCVGDSPF